MKGARAIDLGRAGDPAIRTDVVGKAASEVAAIAAVRAALFDFQREFLVNPPGHAEGAVMDGRDIGTVIAPDAVAKLFVDGAPATRAHRRWLELRSLGILRSEPEVLAEINFRDAADRGRAISPLRPAPDAALASTPPIWI